MRKCRILYLMLVALLGTASCQPIQFTSTGAATSQTQSIINKPSASPWTVTSRFTPTQFQTPSQTISPTFISTPFPDLHTAGPYLFLNSYPGAGIFNDNDATGVGIFYELDGSGRLQITLPNDYGKFSPDMHWYAYITGILNDTGKLPDGGITLHILNLWNDTTHDLANLIPKDYYQRQENMVETLLQKNLSDLEDSGVYYVGNAIQVLESGINNFSWSPNGRFLAYAAMINGISTDVYSYDVETGISQKMVDDPYNVFSVRWSPDGQQILYWDAMVNPDIVPISIRTVRVISLASKILMDFSAEICCYEEWISDSEFLQFYISDAGIGYGIRIINTTTGSNTIIWNGMWLGFSVDRGRRWIMINGDPCEVEGCSSGGLGLYAGPIFGNLRRIADGKYGDLEFRGGQIHSVLERGEDYISAINWEGKIDLLKKGEHLIMSLSPDYQWLAIYGNGELTLFNESDQNILTLSDVIIYDITWKTNSQGLFFITSDQVFYLPMDQLKPQVIVKQFSSDYDSIPTISLIPGIQLASLPSLRAQPPSLEKQIEGKSVWSATTFKDLIQPGINEYSVAIPAHSEWRWDFSWCAKDQAGLEKILAPLDIGFYIDGEKVGEDIFRMYDSAKEGGFCRTWATLLSGWHPGDKTDLEIRYTLREAINDGTREYPAGEYRHIIHISIH